VFAHLLLVDSRQSYRVRCVCLFPAGKGRAEGRGREGRRPQTEQNPAPAALARWKGTRRCETDRQSVAPQHRVCVRASLWAVRSDMPLSCCSGETEGAAQEDTAKRERERERARERERGRGGGKGAAPGGRRCSSVRWISAAVPVSSLVCRPLAGSVGSNRLPLAKAGPRASASAPTASTEHRTGEQHPTGTTHEEQCSNHATARAAAVAGETRRQKEGRP